MAPRAFIGREYELTRLHDMHRRKIPSLVVVKGRRRVGKSRLIAHFASTCPKNKFWSFAGLAPQAALDAQSQRDHFAKQLATILQNPPLTFEDWSDAFLYLGQQLKTGDIILFDEISWMGYKDPTFIPKLKAWWDAQTISIVMVFCGSVSTWIEENILNSTAFFGRVNLTITLEPLSIPESAALLKGSGFKGSPYDLFKLLSVLGGIPWYLEQMTSGQTTDTLIKQLCFEKDSLLLFEFDRIFHDLFNGTSSTYKKILNTLKKGMRTLAEIRKALDFAKSGTLSRMMDHLITAGFVEKQDLWSFKTTKGLKQSLYRLSDPYMRFYLKVIEPQRNKIELGKLKQVDVSHLSGFDSHMGLQLEQLLLQNRLLLLEAMGVRPIDVVADGPFRQSKTTTRPGCQIDYLVQTATRNLFVCEFKFKRSEIDTDIIEQMQHKMRALKVPRGFAVVPVLFHLGGVTDSVGESDFFYRIIDISDFL